MNYNVRYRYELDPVRAWRDATKAPMKAFTNFDGAGFNFYICEFKTLKDAEAFRHHFQIHGEKTLWAEGADGSIHYLQDSKPALAEAKPGPISLKRDGFVPTTQSVAELTFSYADGEATWLNRYNKDNKTLE